MQIKNLEDISDEGWDTVRLPLQLTSTDSFNITGRGQVFTFIDFPDGYTFDELIGSDVLIDGHLYKITSIERFGTELGHHIVKPPVGLLVKPVKTDSLLNKLDNIEVVPSVQDMVIADMEARKQKGLDTYGKLLDVDPHDRSHLQDLYEELLDACCYIKAQIELDKQ